VATNIGRMIRIFRIHAGIKQKELAGKLGITPNYLSIVETGKKQPGRSLIEKAAKELNIPIEYLFLSEQSKNVSAEHKELYDQLSDTLWQLQNLLQKLKGTES
jgi:putative transcriptional regulator